MNPILGSPVLFTPLDAPNLEFPAIVTMLYADGDIALTVFQPEAWAGPGGSQSVARAGQSASGQPEAGCWRWPPPSA